MLAIVTGMNGTVAPYVGQALEAQGYRVLPWDRTRYPTEDDDLGQRFLDSARPDRLFHVGMGPPEWAGFLAAACRERGIRFLYTSTVSVYADRPTGPITPETEPDGTSEYARYKLESERQVRESNPEAVIARIGWQIGRERGSNNMIEYLFSQAGDDGIIGASRRWYPACSFLEDTGEVLGRLGSDAPPGTYLVDSNRVMNFYEIVTALNDLRGRPWTVRPEDDMVLDLRMVDDRIDVPPLETRLGADG
jgi:dTDP-4-dehydrorhamnose reductase